MKINVTLVDLRKAFDGVNVSAVDLKRAFDRVLKINLFFSSLYVMMLQCPCGEVYHQNRDNVL